MRESSLSQKTSVVVFENVQYTCFSDIMEKHSLGTFFKDLLFHIWSFGGGGSGGGGVRGGGALKS